MKGQVMLLTLPQAGQAADITCILTQTLSVSVSDGALTLFRGLQYGAVEAAQYRGYSLSGTAEPTGRGEHFYPVYLAAYRARANVAERYERRIGAMFFSRLKAAPWWSEVWAAPQTKVGIVPGVKA